MSCTIDSGYSLGCRDQQGGVEFVAIATYASGTTYSTTDGGTHSAIDSISGTPTFYKYEQYTEQASSTQTGNFDNANGTTYFTQTVQLVLENMDTDTRNQFLALSKARVRIIIKTQTGKYWLIGKVNGARSSAAEAGPNQALADLAGFNITLEAMEPDPAQEVDATYAESIISS